ncbi:MAG: hypothetical protein WDN08_20525 [Rhizomicrobium sp.]
MLLSVGAHADGARPADCELTVKGKAYIKGVCQFTPSPGGSFQISQGDYFAYLNVTKPGVADASWNETPESTHAQAPLGTLARQGACWINRTVRICARALPPGTVKAVLAAQPNGAMLYPPEASQSCIGVEGPLEPGASLVLHNCKIPDDLIFVAGVGGKLSIAKHPELCLDVEAPGMMKPAELILNSCDGGGSSWSTTATSTAEATVRSSDGLCLTIPQMTNANARFPFRINALPCSKTKPQKFNLEKP